MENIKKFFVAIGDKLMAWWRGFEGKHPKLSQWLREGGLFLIISTAITIVRGVAITGLTELLKVCGVDSAAWCWPNGVFVNILNMQIPLTIIGDMKDGIAGTIGLWVSSFVFEVLNFFIQRKYTFRSNGNLWFQGPIYFVAWMIVMLIVNPMLVILKEVLAGLPGSLITILLSYLQGCVAVVIMFFVNKIIFTDAPKDEIQENIEA